MKEGMLLREWQEGVLTFPPTCPLVAGSLDLDTKSAVSSLFRYLQYKIFIYLFLLSGELTSEIFVIQDTMRPCWSDRILWHSIRQEDMQQVSYDSLKVTGRYVLHDLVKHLTL